MSLKETNLENLWKIIGVGAVGLLTFGLAILYCQKDESNSKQIKKEKIEEEKNIKEDEKEKEKENIKKEKNNEKPIEEEKKVDEDNKENDIQGQIQFQPLNEEIQNIINNDEINNNNNSFSNLF